MPAIPTPTTEQRIVPIPDAGVLLGGINRVTVYALVNSGELVKVNIGRRGFITTASINAYIDRLTAAAEAASA